MEEIIAAIIKDYGGQIWLGFVTLVITGFVMLLLKQFIENLVNYFRARMSDIGFGQRIYWEGQIYVVDRTTFKHIVVKDDCKVVHIPIDKYLEGAREYPLNRFDDFDERKYHQKPWDGRTERRTTKEVD
jgi:hypothetical protein